MLLLPCSTRHQTREASEESKPEIIQSARHNNINAAVVIKITKIMIVNQVSHTSTKK